MGILSQGEIVLQSARKSCWDAQHVDPKSKASQGKATLFWRLLENIEMLMLPILESSSREAKSNGCTTKELH